MNIATEVRELVQVWIDAHPKYGKLQQALWNAKVSHAMVFVGSDGCIYPVDAIDKDLKANYVRPNFFDDLVAMLDIHIAACDICQGLLLPNSI